MSLNTFDEDPMLKLAKALNTVAVGIDDAMGKAVADLVRVSYKVGGMAATAHVRSAMEAGGVAAALNRLQVANSDLRAKVRSLEEELLTCQAVLRESEGTRQRLHTACEAVMGNREALLQDVFKLVRMTSDPYQSPIPGLQRPSNLDNLTESDDFDLAQKVLEFLAQHVNVTVIYNQGVLYDGPAQSCHDIDGTTVTFTPENVVHEFRG